MDLVNSLEVILLRLYVSAVVLKRRRFELWASTFTSVVEDLGVEHALDVVVVVVPSSRLLHASHVVHSVLHRDDAQLLTEARMV